MIRKIKRNYKLGIAFILGLIVSGVVVYAIAIESKNVSYDNSKSGIQSTTLQGALDDLYNKMKTHCPEGYTCTKLCKVVSGSKTTIGSEVNCAGENFYISTTGSTITLIAKYGLNSSYQQSTTPTPVNYSDATNWIENYAKNTLSGIKGNMSFYGHSSKEELIKISTGEVYTNYYGGAKLSIGSISMAYWVESSKIFYYPAPGWTLASVSNDKTNFSQSDGLGGSGHIYARPMIIVSSSVID